MYLYNKKYIIDEFYYDKRKLSNHTLDENETRPSFGNSDSVTHNIIFVDKPKKENSIYNKNINLRKNKTAFKVFVKKKLRLQPTIFFKRKIYLFSQCSLVIILVCPILTSFRRGTGTS